MANHRLVRTILGFLWLASAVVVLGISALGANNDREAGTYRPVIALNLATASLTIIYELIWLPGRFVLGGRPVALAVEAGISFVLWALWVAAAAAYTAETDGTRSVCDNLDLLPQSIIDLNDLNKTCRTYKANLAFAWIAFVLATVIAVYTVYTAVSRRTNNVSDGRSHWAASFGDASRGIVPTSPASTAHVEPKVAETPGTVNQSSAV